MKTRAGAGAGSRPGKHKRGATRRRSRQSDKSAKTGKRKVSRSIKARRRRSVRRRKRSHRRNRSASPARPDPDECYQKGYEDGLRNGPEALLEQFWPTDMIIPELTAEEAMAAGVSALRVRGVRFLRPPEVYAELEQALNVKYPYSFIRLGDGELLTMAQQAVLSEHQIRKVGSFLPYSGVKIPDFEARDELIRAVQAASLVGVPVSRQLFFQPLFLRVVKAYGIDLRTLHLTTSTMNYSLDDEGFMLRLLQGRRVLVIGNIAKPLAAALADSGISVVGTISPVNGFQDTSKVVAEAAKKEFDLALVSAGIAAVPICVRLAAASGKVTIDFGHLANRIAAVSVPRKVLVSP